MSLIPDFLWYYLSAGLIIAIPFYFDNDEDRSITDLDLWFLCLFILVAWLPMFAYFGAKDSTK